MLCRGASLYVDTKWPNIVKAESRANKFALPRRILICGHEVAKYSEIYISLQKCTTSKAMINESNIEEILTSMFDGLSFPASPKGLYDPLRYMIGIGGKRVRPRLCLIAYALFKDDFSDEVLQPAAALEIFHSFTLLHDDIMDKAEMRRGVPTVCRKWNDNTAILSGDVMSIDSFRRLMYAPADVLPKVLDLFTDTAAKVCEGQQLDMDFENMREITMDQYTEMIGLKTAALIACSAKLGALAGRADDRACNLLYDFGYNIGLAFQITDDYLDTFGDPKVFGKKIGGDIVNNKKSWLLTRALEKGGELEASGVVSPSEGKTALLAAMGMPSASESERDAKIGKVRGIYEALGVDEDAKYEIIKLHAAAMECAGRLGLSRIRYEMLHRYADRLIGRSK